MIRMADGRTSCCACRPCCLPPSSHATGSSEWFQQPGCGNASAPVQMRVTRRGRTGRRGQRSNLHPRPAAGSVPEASKPCNAGQPGRAPAVRKVGRWQTSGGWPAPSARPVRAASFVAGNHPHQMDQPGIGGAVARVLQERQGMGLSTTCILNDSKAPAHAAASVVGRMPSSRTTSRAYAKAARMSSRVMRG